MSMKEHLETLDIQLESMGDQNRKMLFISLFLGVVLAMYYMIGLGIQEKNRIDIEKRSQLQQTLSENKAKRIENKITQNGQKKLLVAKKMEEEGYKEMALRTQLERVDYMSSNALGMADILERILKRSVALSVNIDKISLDDSSSEYTHHIEQQGSIRIEGTAAFTSVLKLLRFIESQEALIEVKHVHFDLKEEGQNHPGFVIDISGYGIVL